METKKIEKSIDINAPKNKVWEVLMQDELNRIWYACFSEGSYADTDWKEGSKAVFTDDGKSGLVGKIASNKPNEFLSVEYTGVLANGEEDYDSDEAKAMKGVLETYTLTETDGVTQISISCDMADEYFEMMSASWDKALQKIKELSESR